MFDPAVGRVANEAADVQIHVAWFEAQGVDAALGCRREQMVVRCVVLLRLSC